MFARIPDTRRQLAVLLNAATAIMVAGQAIQAVAVPAAPHDAEPPFEGVVSRLAFALDALDDSSGNHAGMAPIMALLTRTRRQLADGMQQDAIAGLCDIIALVHETVVAIADVRREVSSS